MMIGLSRLQSDLYAALVETHSHRGVPLTMEEVIRASGLSPSKCQKKLDQLIRRKFVVFDRTGRLSPCMPPHQIVCAEISGALTLSMDDIRGPSHLSELVKARRMIARRLRTEFRYPISAICKVLDRGPNTVDAYFNLANASRRSGIRAVRQAQERLAA